ncbi:hypothetical protein O0I10_005603 [Lichtheimia ornata]|uniref:Protein BFR2 n=1 Tax=Lichtheimia ornata TaxID=688661 RepID=A0AAD7V3A3_9FUNG|nr:uncharacterized protein O0I10_005603 [Lichtheimia ornata]KAJ8658563.1 hypothetical protein O0I10_005603 [Lichtheimia ornata]
MPPKKSLLDELADLDSTAPKDYDPEDTTDAFHDRDLDQEDTVDDEKAREHYVEVGKSSLRNSQQFLLDDPRYAGKRATRKDLFSDDEWVDEDQEDDDDSVASDGAEDKDDDSEEDAESWNGFSDGQKDEVQQEDEDEDDEDDEQEQEQSESDEEEEEDEDDEEQDQSEVQNQLRRIQQEEQEMISKMSQSAQGDIEKGQHVREQLSLWERFLESRIRMQKVMDVANQLPQHDTWPDFLAKEEGIEPVLDETKNELREVIDDLLDMRTSMFADNDAIEFGDHTWNSRKRHLEDDDEYIEKLWDDISQVNEVFLPYRNTTLEKWSNKVQVASSARLNKKFKAFDQNVMTQIDNIMNDKDRLIRRTQLQRNDYKILGKKEQDEEDEKEAALPEEEGGRKADRHLMTYDEEIFDDNDFYQQLLRELIDARMVDTDDPIANGMRWAARKSMENQKKKKNKSKRLEMYKGSKGRALKFDVHDKLQNFMAPVPTGTWHEERTEELYSSLLGQKRDILDEAAA